MAAPEDLDHRANWTGGYYELAIRLGARDDLRLELALESVWRNAKIEGCYARVAFRHYPATLSLSSLERHGHLTGVVELPGGVRMVCGVVAVREEHGADWLDFYLPLGALGTADSRVGAFPFGDDGGLGSRGWREPIEDWFGFIGEDIFADVPFEYALSGFEASGRKPEDARDSDGTYYGLLIARDGVLVHEPVSCWDFAGPA